MAVDADDTNEANKDGEANEASESNCGRYVIEAVKRKRKWKGRRRAGMRAHFRQGRCFDGQR